MVSMSQHISTQYDTIWKSVCEKVKGQLKNPDSFDAYFSKSSLLRIEDSSAVLGFPPFVGDLVESNYGSLILAVFKNSSSVEISQIIFEEVNSVQEPINEIPVSLTNLPKKAENESSCDIINGDSFYKDYTFDNFVVGDSNVTPFQAALAVADNPGGNSFNPLTIYGKTGLGKTHLLQAIGHHAKTEETASKVYYITAFDFLERFLEFYRGDRKMESFYREFKDVDILLIDDVQFFSGKKATQKAFYNIFNTLINMNKQIVLTSDRLPDEISDMQETLIDRFKGGLLVDINPPSLKTRMNILHKKAKSDNIQLSNEVIRFMASQAATNIRVLEGIFTKVLASSIFANRELTIKDVKELFVDFSRERKERISIELIQDRVASYFEVTANQLRSHTRKREITHPRNIAMYLSKMLTKQSLKTVGLQFGSRKYSTVIHAKNKIIEQLETDNVLKSEIEQLIALIEG
jgi:chromosomal replication initiator protein